MARSLAGRRIISTATLLSSWSSGVFFRRVHRILSKVPNKRAPKIVEYKYTKVTKTMALVLFKSGKVYSWMVEGPLKKVIPAMEDAGSRKQEITVGSVEHCRGIEAVQMMTAK